jgi:dihydroorotase (multifunctional complex type)
VPAEPFDLEIAGGTVVTAAGRRRASVWIRDGKVVTVSDEPHPAHARVDADGLLVMPGFVDAHVHLMGSVSPERETWERGTAAALASGVTTLIEHTHADPVLTVADLDRRREHAGERSRVDFAIGSHAFPGGLGEVDDLAAAGVAFFKAFTCTTHGVPGLSAGDLLELFHAARRAGRPCLVHCEDESILAVAEARLRSAGREDGAIVPEWRCREAELTAVRNVVGIAEDTGADVVIAHVSSTAVVDLIAGARRRGARVVGETCPQYLTLLESEALEHGPLRKFTPPARARGAVELDAMWAAVNDGAVIEYLASDHAPSTLAQKREASIWDAPFGLPGLDTTAAVLIDAALRDRIPLERLVEIYATAPARRYGLWPRKGGLHPGADADLVLVDPAAERRLEDSAVRSGAGWTPFAGRVVRGSVVATYRRGVAAFEHDEVTAEPGSGSFVAAAGA